MAEQPTKETEVFKPEHVAASEIAPKAKQGVTAMADAFRRARAAAEGGQPIEEPKVPAESPAPATPVAPEKPSPPVPAAASTPQPPKPPEAKSAQDQASIDESFKQLRIKISEGDHRAQELERRLSEATEGTKKYAEIEAQLKAKLEQLEAQNMELQIYKKRAEIEISPEFVEAFDKPIKNAIRDALEAVPAEFRGRVEAALSIRDNKTRDDHMRAIYGELEDEFTKRAVFSAYDIIRQKQRDRDEELSKQKIEFSWEKLAEKRKAEQAVEALRVKQMRDNFWSDLAPEIDTELKASGDEEYAKTAAAKIRGILDGTLDGETFKEVVRQTAKGYKASKTETAKDEEIAKLKAQVEALTASNPTVSLSSKAAPAPAKSMADKFREYLHSGKK